MNREEWEEKETAIKNKEDKAVCQYWTEYSKMWGDYDLVVKMEGLLKEIKPLSQLLESYIYEYAMEEKRSVRTDEIIGYKTALNKKYSTAIDNKIIKELEKLKEFEPNHTKKEFQKKSKKVWKLFEKRGRMYAGAYLWERRKDDPEEDKYLNASPHEKFRSLGPYNEFREGYLNVIAPYEQELKEFEKQYGDIRKWY